MTPARHTQRLSHISQILIEHRRAAAITKNPITVDRIDSLLREQAELIAEDQTPPVLVLDAHADSLVQTAATSLDTARDHLKAWVATGNHTHLAGIQTELAAAHSTVASLHLYATRGVS